MAPIDSASRGALASRGDVLRHLSCMAECRHWPFNNASQPSPMTVPCTIRRRALLAICGLLLLAACQNVPPGATSDADAVRAMAASIERDIGQRGPLTWLDYFDDNPGFFMASDGELQFADIASARRFMTDFAKGVARLDLKWGAIRVENVAPGAATMAAS